MTPEQQAERISKAQASGGLSVPPPPASNFGVSDAACAAWLDRHLTPQPLGSEATRLVLSNPLGNGLPVTYVRCTSPKFPAVEAGAAYARRQADWKYVEVEAGHNVIVTHPQWTIDLLHSISQTNDSVAN